MNKINTFIYNFYTKYFHNNVEDEISKIALKIRKKKIVILDIGCFRGKFSENIHNLLSRKFKTKFYLFDPNPKSSEYLNNLKFNFVFSNVAIDNRKGVSNFHFNNKFEGSGSSLNPLFRKDKYYNLSRRIFFLSIDPLFRNIKVNTIKLSSVFKKYKLTSVEILKIDAEGSELNILKSGENYLSKIKIIYIEISDKKKNWNNKFKKISNILRKYDFEIYKIINIPEGSIFSDLKLCDCIYKKKSIK